MTSELQFQDRYVFAGGVEQVFDALWAQPGGDLLDIRHIVGTPREVGHRQQLRTAYGGVDLLMIETVTAVTRPTHLRVEQQPDGFSRHDPDEREIPFLDSMIADLDAAFLAQFGADPAPTQIDFELAAVGDETEVTFSVMVKTDERLGWLRKRRWRKTCQKEVAEIAKNISARL